MNNHSFKKIIIALTLILNIIAFADPAYCASTAGFILGYVKENPGAVFKFIAHENINIVKSIINKKTTDLAVNFVADNPDSVISYATTHKIPDKLTKGNEAAISVGVKYAAENKQNLVDYITQNKDNIKSAIANNKIKDVAIDYGLKNSDNIIGFVAKNKNEIANLPVLKDATKGSNAEVALGLKYVAENSKTLSAYVSQNKDNIKKAIETNSFKDLAIDYGFKNSDNLLKFAAANKNAIANLPSLKTATKGYEKEVALGLKYIAENRDQLSSYINANRDAMIKNINKGDFGALGLNYLKSALNSNPAGLLKFASENQNEIMGLPIVRQNIKGYEGEVALGLKYASENQKLLANFISNNGRLVNNAIDKGNFEDLGIAFAMNNVDNLANFLIANNAKVKQLPIFKELMKQLSSDGSKNENNGGQNGGGNNGDSGNTGNNGNTNNPGGNTTTPAGEDRVAKLKEKLIDFIIANPQTGVKLIEAYKDVLTPQLVKGYETEVKYGIAYITEEKEAFCKYLKNNQFAKDAIMKGDYKNLAIDYMKKEYMSVLKFVVRHRSELPADVIDMVLKYAVSDKSLSDQVRDVIKNRSIDAETAISIINGIGKNVTIPDKVLGVDVKKITDLIRGNLPGLLFAPAEDSGASKAPAAGENELQSAQSGEQGAAADESVLKAARDRMQSAYKKYIDANAPSEGPLLEEYKNAVEDYKKLTGARQ